MGRSRTGADPGPAEATCTLRSSAALRGTRASSLPASSHLTTVASASSGT